MPQNEMTAQRRIEELEQRLREREAELSILKETSDAAAHQLNLDKLLQLIAERAHKLLQAETILINVLNRECTHYTYRAGFGEHAAEIVGETLPLEFGVCGWVWRHKKPWWRGVLDELEEHERNRWEKEAGTIILVPLIGKEHFLGGIAGINKIGGEDFNKQDLDLLSLFATQVTAAVENAFLYEQLQDLNASLESRVSMRTAELEATNRELESFCYSVSHDLRAPLRAIDGFSEALMEDYSDSLDESGKGYIERVRAASQRMGELIDDLLKLSRVNRAPLSQRQVDLSALAESVIQHIRETDGRENVDITIAPDLTTWGDRNLLNIVLDNLLGNAWKYTKLTRDARIEFGSMKQNGQTVFYVKDNGAGFDMAYADKLFTPFQRLHGHDFEGSGIGLATVQRIVHRHAGRVWADSKVGQGAVFYFSLWNPEKTA